MVLIIKKKSLLLRTNFKKAKELKKHVKSRFPKVWEAFFFCGNAGIGMGGNPLHESAMEDYDLIFDLNSKGVFAGMKYGAEAIFRSGSNGGFLINVASIAGIMPQRGQALYTATKFGVVGMTKSAALDYAKYNITVNAICPGYTMTTMFEGIPDEAMAFFLNDCPSGRLGDPYECAYLALFLASDMARYISGAAIPVDGALSAGSKNITTWSHPEIRKNDIENG